MPRTTIPYRPGRSPFPLPAWLQRAIGEGSPMDLLQPLGAVVRLQPERLEQFLWSGAARRLLGRFPLLQPLVEPSAVGSSDIARAASGVRGWPWRAADEPPPTPAWLARARAQQLYRATQEALHQLGADPGDVLELYRGGPLPTTPYILTPTTVTPGIAEQFAQRWGSQPPVAGTEGSGPYLGIYHVPREAVRALVGLLRRGDPVTEGELLVPSGILQRTAQRSGPVPMIHRRALTIGIPRWARTIR